MMVFRRHRNGLVRFVVFRRIRSDVLRSSLVRQNQRQSIVGMHLGALCMVNSFTGPLMRLLQSQEILAWLVEILGSAMGQQAATVLNLCRKARTRLTGGYPDIKLIYSMAGDIFNQAPNTSKTVRALDNVEFIVGQDHFLTPTARYADIVLPATTFWERNDVHTPWAGAGHYAIFMKQPLQPMYECRNDIDIVADLAKRVGIEGFNNKSELEWLKEFTEDRVDDFDAFMKEGVARFPEPEDAVAFAKQIRDPQNHKFSTPSGKIEIYSTNLAENPDPFGPLSLTKLPDQISLFKFMIF